MNISNFAILACEIVILIGLSAICSGLNIALMSLDVSDLRRKAKLGNREAKQVLPLRTNSHLSLAAILFTNVAAVSATSLVTGHYVNGFIAGAFSTVAIVVFGEVLPQAYFVRRALHICAVFSPVLKTMIVVTYPIAKPLQLLLDRLFGSSRSVILQSRRELGMVISEHVGQEDSELDENEIEIIRGALTLSEKQVKDIMTPLENTFWFVQGTRIDEKTIDEIKAKGRSRIPVLNSQRTTCFGLILMKDLVDTNFDEEPTAVEDLPLHPTQVVGSMTALDTLFRKFIRNGVHLMPVERDDKIVGIVTIEDLLEEIVGHEIEDETDRQKRNSHLV